MDWTCGDCGAAWAPGAPCCPHCRSLNHTEGVMPKATVEGGASDYQAGVPADAAPPPAVPEPPSPRAPKADLVEHAVTVAGVDPEAAAAMTKTELVETIASAVPPAAPPPPPPPG